MKGELMHKSQVNVNRIILIIVAVICAVMLSSIAIIFKPLDVFAISSDEIVEPNGGSDYYCDPSVRSTVYVSDIPMDYQSYYANQDNTLYHDSDDWVGNIQLSVETWTGVPYASRRLVIRWNTESGSTIFTDIAYHFYIAIEAADGSQIATLTLFGETEIDKRHQGALWRAEWTTDKGGFRWENPSVSEYILKEIVDNPEFYPGVKIYVYRVWVED